MIGRLLLLCSRFWGVVNASGAAIAEYGAARKRGCQQRMRRAIGLPPLPEIPAEPAAE